jgi:DNA primase
LQPLSSSQKTSLSLAAATYEKQLSPQLMAYLAGRGLDAETVANNRFGQICEPLNGHEYLLGRLVIPYIGPRGNIYDLGLRCMEHADCKAEGHDKKYTSLPGFPNRVYNVRALVSADDSIHVTEGELDAVTLGACGLSAVGIPGVENMPAHFPRMIAGFSSVTLWADGDEAGRKFAGAFTKAVPNARVLSMTAGEDCNSLYVAKGKAGVMAALAGEHLV